MPEETTTQIVQLIPAPLGWEAVFHPIDSVKGDFRTPVGAWALIETGDPPVQEVVGMVATMVPTLRLISEMEENIEFVRYEVCVSSSSDPRFNAAVRSR